MFSHDCLGDYRVLHVEGRRLWVSDGYRVHYSDDDGTTFCFRAAHAAPFPLGRLGGLTIAERLVRAGFLSLLPLKDGGLVASVKRRIIHCEPDSECFVTVLSVPRRRFKLCSTPGGLLYAGEYFLNPRREEVRVFCSSDLGRTWDIVYTFPPGTIRHIHNILYDSYRECLVVLTGDLDHEAKVMTTSDGFRSLNVVSEGGQRSRAVGAIPVLEGYYLPTDTPFEQNYVQFLSLDGKLTNLCPISGSCLAACRVGEWCFFGTAAEPSPVNLDPTAVLYGTRNGSEWHVISRWRVDRWSGLTRYNAVLFQMARVLLPVGENRSGFLFATPFATRASHGALHRWRVE